MWCDEDPGAVAVAKRHFVRVRRHPAVRDRFRAIGRRIAAGQHRNDSWPTDRLRHIRLYDRRVRVERSHEVRVGLAWQVEIVCVLSCAGEQSCVLTSRHRFPDAIRGKAFTGRQKRHQALITKCVSANVPCLVQLRLFGG